MLIQHFAFLRNDNPANIIDEKPDENPRNKPSEISLECLNLALKLARQYFSIQLYEDAMEYAEKVLSIDDHHVKALLIKTKSLAYLKRFDESRAIFTNMLPKDKYNIR